MDRREFLRWLGAAAAALALPGCGDAGGLPPAASRAPPRPSGMASGPRPPPPAWAPPAPGAARPLAAPAPGPAWGPSAAVLPSAPAPAAAAFRPVAVPAGPPVIARSSWRPLPPDMARMKPMGAVDRLTVHHDGNPKPNNDLSAAAVAQTLRLVQAEHRQRMNAGDIGYHYIVDRAGQVWQGRDERFQGAHVGGANAGNVGVLCLGNGDLQAPTPRQLEALDRLVRTLANRHRLPAARVYGHRELANTRCPGDHLARQVALIKGRLA